MGGWFWIPFIIVQSAPGAESAQHVHLPFRLQRGHTLPVHLHRLTHSLVDELEERPVKQEEQEEVTFPLGASSAIHSGPEPGWTPFARSWLEFEKYKSNKNEIDLEIHPTEAVTCSERQKK